MTITPPVAPGTAENLASRVCRTCLRRRQAAADHRWYLRTKMAAR